MSHAVSDLLHGLNQQQQEAVLATSGPVLVVAGPGSGKTRVLTHRIAHLIQNENVIPEEILAVTFTNKAAGEIKKRVEGLIGPGAANGMWMGTFHSIGVRFLRQNPGLVADRLGILPNFVIYDDADQVAIAKQAIVANNLDVKNVAPRRMLARISAAKSQLLSPTDFVETIENYGDEIVSRVYREYQALLGKANAVDFDDLLVLPIRLFDSSPQILERYQQRFRHILVDEYQDTNRVQYVLVSALAEYHRNLFVVGDPDQSIYAWRQADIRNILEFQEDFPDARLIKLETNYRSTRRIVETADRLIRENTQRIERTLITENDEGEMVSLRELSDERHEARFIVDEIRRLQQSTGVRADQIAVMYRTTAQSRVIEESFRMSGIPYRIIGGLRFYERKEVKDVIAFLRIIHNPADELSLNRVIDNMPIGRGIGPKAIDAVRAWAEQHNLGLVEGFVAAAGALDAPALAGAARSSAQRLGFAIAQLRELEKELTLSELFDALVEKTGYQSAFHHENEEEMERWANVLELRNDLEDFDALGPGEALAAYLDQVQLVSDADTMKDDAPEVTLITLHSAKGLEYPIVFIAGVEEGLLPVSRAIEEEPTNPNAIEEERRLFYVGITRAEKLLYLTHASGRARYGKWDMAIPSRFLANLPVETVRTVGRQSVSGPVSLVGRARSQFATSNSRSSDAPIRTTTIVPDWVAERNAPGATEQPPVSLEAGLKVFHPKFGEGEILSVTERRGDQEYEIAFKLHGTKRLLASLAKLDIIE
ncbi:MAG: UvrD-helicase domain-containing protein [Thermomicrobiales bacterium]|nr:UvrD-helicase domain-containing protein [Thermomicrobiales bacterium]